MSNARSIPPAAWQHARAALVFFFSRRHSLENAEDLAQETLATLWAREDYEFQSSEDFLRVCYGFARRILHQGHRETRKHAAGLLDPATAVSDHSHGMKATEMGILLDEVYKVGQTRLSQKEWKLIELAADSDRTKMAEDLNMGDANNVRVQLHRARRKLAQLTGWHGK